MIEKVNMNGFYVLQVAISNGWHGVCRYDRVYSVAESDRLNGMEGMKVEMCKEFIVVDAESGKIELSLNGSWELK